MLLIMTHNWSSEDFEIWWLVKTANLLISRGGSKPPPHEAGGLLALKRIGEGGEQGVISGVLREFPDHHAAEVVVVDVLRF